MATLTGTFANATPRLSYEGGTFARGEYVANGRTVSASDTYLMVKVPNGATIIDGYISGTAGNTATVFEVGVMGVDNNIAALLTLSATAEVRRFNAGGLPLRVSLSDDAVPQWSWMFVTVASTGSATNTASIQLVVEYAAPGAI